MSLVALVADGDSPTVVDELEAFEAAEGSQGTTVLLRGMDRTQLRGDSSNVSYDLRVGREYMDHRNLGRQTLDDDDEIPLPPGAAVILETEESIRLPRSRFAFIVPKVGLLQDGVSNTMSKVDPGYDGPLLVTLFNLGKKTVKIARYQSCCALCVFQVEGDVALYNRGPQRIQDGRAVKRRWHAFRDWLERNTALVVLATPFVAAACQIAVWVLVRFLERGGN